MTRTEIFTQNSPWYILLCLLAGAFYAYLLYSKKPVWRKTVNRILAAARFLIVTFICFLLLSPIIKQINNFIEKPILVIGIDNSESLAEVHNKQFLNRSVQQLREVAKKLNDKYDVEFKSLDSKKDQLEDSVKFDYPVSNLSTFLADLQSKYEGQNLAEVVLFTDGIYNQGISPDYQTYGFSIHPVAAGDTVPKKDFNLRNLIYNKVVYRGNKFPIVAELTGEGYLNEEAKITLEQNGRVLESKSLKITNRGLHQVTFYASSNEAGMQHYTINITKTPGEFTFKNNVSHAYIDVIDNKEKILLVALAPHPDIKAIKNAIETKENYEFTIYIPGIGSPPKENKFDLIIFHQIPDLNNITIPIYNEYKKKTKNILFVLGNQSGLNQFNTLTESIDIYPRGIQKDEVFPFFNKTFTKFTLDEGKLSVLSKLPPVVVPFAEFQVPPVYEVLLYQKVGNVETKKPLIALGNSTNGEKTGIITGNGIWEWRIQEFAINQNTQLFDELITKVIQYLSSKEDKRKFRVYPLANEVFESESLIFETEVYNNIYEKIYGQKIDLELINESGKKTRYSYINSQNNSRYEIGGLPHGIYKYSASTTLEGKKEVSNGQFIIKELQLESLNITANHQLLKELAKNTNGKFYYPSQISTLAEDLSKNETKGKLHSFEENLEIIHLKWLFFVLLLLISFEWAFRKYSGSY